MLAVKCMREINYDTADNCTIACSLLEYLYECWRIYNELDTKVQRRFQLACVTDAADTRLYFRLFLDLLSTRFLSARFLDSLWRKNDWYRII